MSRSLLNFLKRVTEEELNNLSDIDVATRMSQVSYAKYKALVRSHLSLVLDVNTDEFDRTSHAIEYVSKNGQKKRLECPCRDPKRRSIATENMSTKFNRFLFHWPELIDFLTYRYNIVTEGIFRISGTLMHEHELSIYIQTLKTPIYFANKAHLTVHDCATIFKVYLYEMCEPLLTVALYPAFLEIEKLIRSVEDPNSDKPWSEQQTARMMRKRRVLVCLQLLMLLLPDENRHLMRDIVVMLNMVVAHKHYNKMSAFKLAWIFAPSLITPRNIPRTAMHYISRHMAPVLEFMVYHGADVFDVPAKLAADMRSFFSEQRQKMIKNSESDSDMPTSPLPPLFDHDKTA